MILGSLLRRHRRAAGLTQEELSERADVSARTVSDVERGLRTRIYRDTATRLCDALSLEGEARADFLTAAKGDRSDARTSNLPTPPTTLIGRSRELDLVVEMLRRPEIRCITLTGPGGIGKTRLALEVGVRAGVPATFFVELGTLTEAHLVIPTVARAVSVSGA